MKMTTTNPEAPDFATRVPWRVLLLSIAVALARVTLVLGVAACLVVALLDAIAEALVYTIAAVLALFWSSCSALSVAHSSVTTSAQAAASETTTMSTFR